MKLRHILLASLLALSSGTTLASQNWTSIQGDNLHTGYVAVQSDPAKLQILWNKKLSNGYHDQEHPRHDGEFNLMEGVIVVDDTLYATTAEYVYGQNSSNEKYSVAAIIALDTNTGITKWQHIIGYDDMVSRPLYDGDRVLVAGYNNTGYMNAYLSSSGKMDYSIAIGGTIHDGGPLAYHGNVYVQANRETAPAELFSYNSTSGKLNWVQPADPKNIDPPVPAMNDNHLIQVLLNGIEVRDPATGQITFSIPMPKGVSRNEYGTSYPIFDEKNNIVYHAFRDFREHHTYASLFAIDLNTRSIKWEKDNQFSQAILTGDEIATSSERVDEKNNRSLYLNVLDAKTGKDKWHWFPKTADDNFSTFGTAWHMVATQDLVFIPCRSKTIAISRKTHEKVWEIAKTGVLAIGDHKLFIVNHEIDEWAVTAVALS